MNGSIQFKVYFDSNENWGIENRKNQSLFYLFREE